MIGLVQTSFQWFGQRIIQSVHTWRDQKLNQAGAEWLSMSRSLAPKKTGRLIAGESYTVANGTLTLHMDTPYDLFVEFGTRYMAPRPHVRPALNAIGRIFGAVEMQFAAPFIAAPIFAHKGGFIVPRTLTARQRHHVQTSLLPTSQWLHKGNVRRAKFRVRRTP